MRLFVLLVLASAYSFQSGFAENAPAKPQKEPAKPKAAAAKKANPAKKAATGPKVYAPTKSPEIKTPPAKPKSPQVITPIPTYQTPPFFPWKRGITASIFWIGEDPSQNNPTHNYSSAWDLNWTTSYGGFDDPNPTNRVGLLPRFMPGQNPFYVALPYNDVSAGQTKPEASRVIPWFKSKFRKEGRTVLRGQWVAIKHKGKVCFAQWEDVGPFETDDWMYVFGNARPKNIQNDGAGIDVSPAVRDYLKLRGNQPVDWRFVSLNEISSGPWKLYGNNNHFVQMARANSTQIGGYTPPPKPKSAAELYRDREQWLKQTTGS